MSSQLQSSVSAWDLLQMQKMPITNSCKSIDNLIGGGVYSKAIYEVCGLPGLGKTQWCMQLSVNCIKNQHKVLYIDTEGSLVVSRLLEIAQEPLDLTQLFIVRVYSRLELMSLLHSLNDFLIASIN